MNNVNILGSKIVDHKFFFPLLTILTFLIYIPLLNSIPFGDDYVYIFNNGHILNAPHPLVYWNYGTEAFKSWPLSFSILWAEYKVFGDNFIFYRLVNLLIHSLNVFLLYKALSGNFPKVSKYISIIFMIHPMVVENIYWIFQIKTLLAFTFLLLTIIKLQAFNKKSSFQNYFMALAFFLASLLTKSTAILFPFALFFFFKRIKSSVLILLTIPFFIFSGILGVESLKGVTSFKGEERKIQNFHKDYFKKKKDFLSNNKISLTDKNINTVKTVYVPKFDFKKYQKTLSAYMNSIFNNEAILIKTTVITSSLAFYIKAMLGLTINQIVYRDLDLSNSTSYILPLLLIFSLFLFIKLEKKYFLVVFIGILFFIPISGLLYVPYMQYSYVADHWFYASLPFFLAILLSKLIHSKRPVFNKYLPLALLIICSIQTFTYSTRLSNTKAYFYNELARHKGKSQIIHEYLIELEKKDKNDKKALNLSTDLYRYSTSKRALILDNIIQLAVKVKDQSLESRYLQKKSILHFINGSIFQAKELLHQIPIEKRGNNFIFLSNLYDHADKKIYKDRLVQLNKILLK